MKKIMCNGQMLKLALCGLLALGVGTPVFRGLAAQSGSADAATVAVDALEDSADGPGVSLPDFLKAGPFEFRPYFTGSMLYDDNIRIQSANPINDVVWTLSPGLLIGGGQYDDPAGTYVTLDYRPDIVLYTDHDEFNSVDHWVNAFGQRRWEKLTLGLGQAFQSGPGGYTEALNRVDRSIYLTTARALYAYSDKTSFELTGIQNVSDYSDDNRLSSYNQWEGRAWINYQATPKVNTGLGGTFGWRDVTRAENQTYQQALVRGVYTLTEKTRLHGSVGMEFQQYQEGGDRGPMFVFDLGGAYQPWHRTTFTLSAFRRNQNSVVRAGENYTTTGFRAGVRQHVRDRVVVSLNGGYEDSSYYAAGGSSPGSGREDQYWFIGPAIDYTITDRWFLGLFYRYRSNDSNRTGNDFDNNQAGFRTVFRF